VSDLERRLAEVGERGVQATREVQLAAQLVVRENASLRELLRRTGFDDEAIDAWVRQSDYGSPNAPRPRSGEQIVPEVRCSQVSLTIRTIKDARLIPLRIQHTQRRRETVQRKALVNFWTERPMVTVRPSLARLWLSQTRHQPTSSVPSTHRLPLKLPRIR
jgi:hypothetical protein